MGRYCSVFFWRGILAEFLGSTIYICVVLGVALNSDYSKNDDQLRLAIAFGLTLAGISNMLASSSGGIINPAVTLACAIAKRINVLQMVGYLIVQCGGGMCLDNFLCCFNMQNERL